MARRTMEHTRERRRLSGRISSPTTERTTTEIYAVDPGDGAQHESSTRDKGSSCHSCLSLRAELVALKAERAEQEIKIARMMDSTGEMASASVKETTELRVEIERLKAERANEIRNIAADMINTTFQRWRTTVQSPSSFSHEDGVRFIKIMSEVVENWPLPPPPASSEIKEK